MVILAVADPVVAGESPDEVPEIDASGAVTALSILAGAVALAVERLRRK